MFDFVMASLKRRARLNVKMEKKEDVSTDGVLELSVTIGYLAADVQKEEISKLERLLHDYCDASVVSLERGDVEQHLHFQMVCKARAKLARSFGSLCRKYMEWHGKKNMSPTGKVMCKALTNRMIHTWKGMIGYCLRDSGKTHFEVVMHNISDDEVVVGKTLHSIYSKADLKCRVVLTNKNIGERAYVWYKYNEQRQMTATMLSTLTSMISSAMFIPSSSWIIHVSGQGIDHRRLNSYWKCLVDPTNIDRADVADVFIRKKEYVKGRYWDDDPPEPKKPDAPTDEYVYEGTTVVSRDRTEACWIPRSLNVPPLSGKSSVEVKKEVLARSMNEKGKRKLFEEVPYLKRPAKSVTFGDSLGDFVPIKDIVPLPDNVFLPTNTTLSSDVKKEPLTDGEFWESLTNKHWVGDFAGVHVSSCSPKGKHKWSSGASTSTSVAAVADSTSPMPLVVLLSSDSEDELPERSSKPSAPPLKATEVFEDRGRAIKVELVPQYDRVEDDIMFTTKVPCYHWNCDDPPMQCRGRCH